MDKSGFEELYAATWRDILGYALRRTAGREDAADVVAEVFTVAWRRLADVPAGADGRLWLFGVARHVLANQQRGELRRDRLAGVLREALAAAPPDPAHVAAARAEAEEVLRALRALPDTDRELLTLVAWDGLSPAEAARVLGLSAATVRVRLHRARHRLRKELEARVQRAPRAGHVLSDGRLPVPVEEPS